LNLYIWKFQKILTAHRPQTYPPINNKKFENFRFFSICSFKITPRQLASPPPYDQSLQLINFSTKIVKKSSKTLWKHANYHFKQLLHLKLFKQKIWKFSIFFDFFIQNHASAACLASPLWPKPPTNQFFDKNCQKIIKNALKTC
jgi:hypothetical protein